MKLPKPKQKENGKWLIQVMVDGQRVSKQFDTEDEALYWAAGIKTKQKENEKSAKNLTIAQAIDRYIESKSSVLSPSTIVGYRRVQKLWITDVQNIKVADIEQEQIQRWVNKLSRAHSPKTVSNSHGLISAILKEYRPSMSLHTTLPKKIKPDIKIPSESDLRAIIQAAKGTKYELPILLAIAMGLRQSEILGLKWDCVDGDTLHIRSAVVFGEDGPVQKGTKSYAGKRDLTMPQHIKGLIDAQPKNTDYVITMSAKAMYSGFSRICEKSGVGHFRFHDLRHANASIMLAIGIPDKYSMKRMGHKTNNMLKTTYQHTIKEHEQKFDALIDAEIEKLLQSE
jgi:integrase